MDGREAIPDKSVVKMIIDPDHSGSQPHSFGGESSGMQYTGMESSTTASLQSSTTSLVCVDYKTIAFILLLSILLLWVDGDS